MKRVLFLSPFPSGPLYGGPLVRIDRILRHLARRHQVWFACRGGLRPGDRLPCPVVPTPASRWRQVVDPATLWRLARFVRVERIETLVVSSLVAGLQGALLKLLTGRRLLFDDHNAEFVRLRRDGHPLWPLAALLEAVVCRTADRVTCVSQVDRQHLVRTLGVRPERIRVVPNGVDPGPFPLAPPDGVRRRLGLHPTAPLVLFFGVLGYPPNTEAAVTLLREILPRLRGACQVVVAGVGREVVLRRIQPPENAVLPGFVEDLPALIAASHVVAAPLASGSGTRMKLLEARALGRRCVTTSVGAEGLDAEALGLTVRDDWDAFARAVEEALASSPDHPPPPALQELSWDRVLEGLDP